MKGARTSPADGGEGPSRGAARTALEPPDPAADAAVAAEGPRLRSLLLAIYVPTVITSVCDGVLTATLPLFVASLESSLALVGLALAGEAVGTLIGDVPAGWFVDRASPKAALLLGGTLVATAVLATAAARDLRVVLALRVLAGVGIALFNLARHSYLAQATRSGGRGRLIALYGGVNRFGSFAGPALGGGAAALFGLGAPLVLYAALMLGAVALVALSLPGVPAAAPRARGGEAARRAMRASVPALLNAGLGQVLGQAVRAGRRVLLPLFGSQVLGLDPLQVGIVVSAGGLADMSLSYPAGWLMDRRGRKAAIVPSFLVTGLALALVPLAGGFWALVGVSVLVGVGNGLGSGTMMTLAADLAPREAASTFLGWWRLIGDAGMVGGPVVVGLVAQAAALGPAAVAVGALGVLAAGWFGSRVPETAMPLSSGIERTGAA